MIIVETIAAPVLQQIGGQVLDLVAENVTDLSMRHPPVSHPLFSAFRLSLLTELRAYLARPAPSHIELVTATEDGQLVGFALCGLSLGVRPECGIYYTAVAKSRRCEGILTLMVGEIISKYAVVSLSCDVRLVSVYKGYGFEPISIRKQQIVMAIGQPSEETPILDPDGLANQPPIIQEQMEASARSTKQAVKAANKAMEKMRKTETTKAKNFLVQYMKAKRIQALC